VLQTAPAPSILPQANDPCWCGSGRKYKRCHKPLEGKVLPGVISPRRTVPEHIPRPPYAETGVVTRWAEGAVKSPEIVERMRHAGATAAEVLRLAGEFVRPGITTDEIDVYVHEPLHRAQRLPEPAQLQRLPRRASAPARTRSSATASRTHGCCRTVTSSTSTSPTFIGGVHGDTNATFFVGDVDPASRQLVQGDGGVHVARHRGRTPAGRCRHRAGDRDAREDAPLRRRAGRSSATASASSSTPISRCSTTTTSARPDHAPRHDLHDRADDHDGAWQHRMWDDDWTAVTTDGKRTRSSSTRSS
jgi:methionyl aminopeptidase